MIIHKRGFVKEERILVKKYIEFIYKFILVISILIGICIFVKSRTIGNKSEIEELIKYYIWGSTALLIFIAFCRTIFKPEWKRWTSIVLKHSHINKALYKYIHKILVQSFIYSLLVISKYFDISSFPFFQTKWIV